MSEAVKCVRIPLPYLVHKGENIVANMFKEVIKNNISYGQAMHEAIVEGQQVARAHWGGYWTNDTSMKTYTQPVLVAVLRDNLGVVPAVPYNEDIQATDWMVVI